MSDPRHVRIGIDVGGTFTHAVALAAATGRVLGKVRVPTTHRHEQGVARGVADALRRLLAETDVAPEEAGFIAHSTTQATNALLEGDVARVGVLCLGRGAEGAKASRDTDLGVLELPTARREVHHRYLDLGECDDPRGRMERLARELAADGAQVLVAAEAFSVDDASGEALAMEAARAAGLLATGTHEVSGLYGLRARTRTSVVNASILPTMMAAVEATDAAVAEMGVSAPLMIVRSDGGVMTVGEVRIRPVRTLLSGPAAGVAAAVVHLGIADGVFVEVGGTSTDVSAIVDGRPRERTATVGGHRLHLQALDIETLSVAGGSMLRSGSRGRIDVGPRSAHIAGLPYYCFDEAACPQVAERVAPTAEDPREYVVLRGDGGEWAFALTCAQRTLDGLCPPRGAEIAASLLDTSPEALCEEMLRVAGRRTAEVIRRMASDAGLAGSRLRLIGGGGGCDALVPAAGRALGLDWRRCEDAEVISAIGVARAVLRESISRNIADPTEDDLAAMRAQVIEALTRMGASPAGVEVAVEVDAPSGIVTATGTAPVELDAATPGEPLDPPHLEAAAREAMELPDGMPLRLVVEIGGLGVYQATVGRRGFLGLFGGERRPVAVVDQYGRVRLQREDASVVVAGREGIGETLGSLVDYGDHGARIPPTQAVLDGRILDLTGVPEPDQARSLLTAELDGHPGEGQIAFVRGDR
jgi:N-methylhydantoinase A/oxoprolinase/acetone carboxylase beta subunit